MGKLHYYSPSSQALKRGAHPNLHFSDRPPAGLGTWPRSRMIESRQLYSQILLGFNPRLYRGTLFGLRCVGMQLLQAADPLVVLSTRNVSHL